MDCGTAQCRRFESGLRYFLFKCFCLPCGVGCGGAVGQSFTKPPSPANPPSSFRHNEPIDRATHHRAWDPRAAPGARMVRSAVLLFGDVYRAIAVVDAFAVFWVETWTASRTLRNHQKIAPSGERCSPDGCPYSIQADKGKSSRFSLRSPGNAKPEIDDRNRRITVKAIRRRSEPTIVIERAATQHPGN